MKKRGSNKKKYLTHKKYSKKNITKNKNKTLYNLSSWTKTVGNA